MTKELEALKRIKNLQVCIDYEKDIVKSVDEILPNYCNKVEQALLKALEQEKVIEIIFKKRVSMFLLKCCKDLESYNYSKFNHFEKLTQEEFNLLKRYQNDII